jgi:hypothetical protein
VKAVQQEAKACWAERAALFDAARRRHASAAAPAHADGVLCVGVQRVDSRQHGAVHAQACQRLPQQRSRHAVVGPLHVQEAADEWLPQAARAVEQVLQVHTGCKVDMAGRKPGCGGAWRPAASVYATSRSLSSAA